MSELVATLLKFLASLLAVAAVLAIGYTVAQSGNAGNHSSDLATVTGNVQQLYSAQPTFTSLSNTVAAKYAPSRMKTSDTSLINPWGGTVTFSPNTNTVLFDVTTNGVPDGQCASLAKTVSGYKNLKINGTTFVATATVDAGDISVACGSTGNDLNTLTFTFGH